MSTYNICFYGEIIKTCPRVITKYSSLTTPDLAQFFKNLYYPGLVCKHFTMMGLLRELNILGRYLAISYW